MYLKLLLTCLFFTIIKPGFEVHDDMATAIKSGNADNMTALLAPMVDLTIAEKEGNYSKQQTVQIVRDFFGKHPVKDFRIMHKGEAKDGSKYAIGSLQTANGSYRVYFLAKKSGEKMLVQQLRFESE